MVVKPYKEKQLDDNTKIRVFHPNTNESELTWHRDERNRVVEVVRGDRWYFQYDNETPFELNVGDKFFIPSKMYHRIINGITPLVIKILEL